VGLEVQVVGFVKVLASRGVEIPQQSRAELLEELAAERHCHATLIKSVASLPHRGAKAAHGIKKLAVVLSRLEFEILLNEREQRLERYVGLPIAEAVSAYFECGVASHSNLPILVKAPDEAQDQRPRDLSSGQRNECGMANTHEADRTLSRGSPG